MTSSTAAQNGHAPDLPTTPPPRVRSPTTTTTTTNATTTTAPTITPAVDAAKLLPSVGNAHASRDDSQSTSLAPDASLATSQDQHNGDDHPPPAGTDLEMPDAATPQKDESQAQETDYKARDSSHLPDANANATSNATPAPSTTPAPTTRAGADAGPSPYELPVPRTPMNSIDSNAYMAMALAQMAGDQMLHPQQRHHHHQAMQQPPSTVTPSQVTLPNSMNHISDGDLAQNSNLPVAHDLQSFARIEFADSVFQMTTYAVIIGRDQRALEQARRDEKRAEEHRRLAEHHEMLGLPPPSPIRQDRGKFSKSYVSEEGGMLGPESDSDETGRPKKRRKTSTQGSSGQEADESQENLISNRQYISHTPGAAAVDLESLRPSPYHVPIIAIHSPGPDIASKTKAISREHLRLQFNKEKGVFEAIPLHKNGFFVGDILQRDGAVVLRSGDHLQIKDVDFRFLINGVPEGKTGAEVEGEDRVKKPYIGGGKEMSFEFEASHGNGDLRDTSSSSSELSPPAPSDDENDQVGESKEPEEAQQSARGAMGGLDAIPLPTQPETTVEPIGALEALVKGEPGAEQLMPDPMMPVIPKKRGPGRPPKNGIMSKREQRLLKKQAQEMAKKTLPQPPPTEPPVKRKVGRPRKHPLPEDGSERPEKRKYKPRKPKEEGGEGSDAERRAKEKKDKKVRPKSPPLELRREDYTDDQLQKPNKNYGVLIDETLTTAHAEGRPEGLTLKQIYKRITLKYPWFYFHTETKGWESSVRHNLIGNEAFKKDDATGLWSRVPGVELDAGKKRKATSPDRPLMTGYGPYGHPMYPPYAGAPQMAPGAQGYQQPPSYPGQGFVGQQGQAARHPQYSPPSTTGAAAQPAGQPGSTQPVAPAQLPGYGAAPVAQASTYSSPYASRPPPNNTNNNHQNNPAVKTEEGSGAPMAATAVAPAVQPSATASPASAATPQVSGIATGPGASTQAAAAAAAAAARQTQTPPVQTPARPVIDPRLLRSVVGLKNGLVENLKKAKNAKAEAIVVSALNRCLGLKANATENAAMEDICMRGIQKLLDGYSSGQSKSPTPGEGSSVKPANPGIFDPRVLNALVGFKNVTANALRASVGEDRAEIVALSAIDRVLGLSEASIVPPRPGRDGSPPEAGKPSSHEGLEQRLMGSVRQLLQGLNQKLPGT